MTTVTEKARCSIAGCDRPSRTRGWCKTHYMRWHRSGDPGTAAPQRAGRKSTPPEDRFLGHVQVTDGCWIWTGYVMKNGYGVTTDAEGRKCLAHRLAHQLWIGPIPEGCQVDHVCFQRSCVNPTHLEAVTPTENLRRVRAAGRPTGRGPKPSTHCGRGHEMSPENTRWSQLRTGHRRRHCRACDRLWRQGAAA